MKADCDFKSFCELLNHSTLNLIFLMLTLNNKYFIHIFNSLHTYIHKNV